MDKKKVLEELNTRLKEVEAEYSPISDKLINMDGSAELKAYEATKSQEERKEKFPELYAMHEKLREIEEKSDELEKEILVAAREVAKEIDDSIIALQEKLQVTKGEREQLEKETEKIKEDLKNLKETDEYKNGDVKAVAEAKELEASLRKNRTSKGNKTKIINSLAKELEEINKEKEALMEEYGEDIFVAPEQPVQTQEAETIEEGSSGVEPKEQEELTEKQRKLMELDSQIAALEAKIDEYNRDRENAMKEIRAIDEEITALKQTEKYKSGDEETLKKVEQLEKELKIKILTKNKIVETIKAMRKDVKKLQAERAAIAMETEQPIVEEKDQSAPEVISEGETAKNNVAKGEPEKAKSENKAKPNKGGVTYVPEAETPKKSENVEKTPKEEFDELYTKAKKGKLTQEDFDKLSTVMSDPENYDKLGITTGIVFNKSKVVLKAMASMVATTGKTVKLSREKLGLAIEKADDNNGYLSTASIKEWKGLKSIMADPSKKIASEELFKRVVAMDRASLTDEQKEVWDGAQEHLNKFEALRGSLQACKTVSRDRIQSKWSWLFEFTEDQPKSLPAKTSSEPEVTKKSLGDELSGKVNKEPDFSSIKPTSVSRSDREKEK